MHMCLFNSYGLYLPLIKLFMDPEESTVIGAYILSYFKNSENRKMREKFEVSVVFMFCFLLKLCSK